MGADWSELELAAPELAAHGRALLERFGFLFAGTVRADGTPRISPVEAHLVGGRLTLALVPHSLKVRDLRRDDRLTLQSPVTRADAPEEELKLRGRAVAVTDPAQLRAAAEAVEARSGWRPSPSWHVCTVTIEAASGIEWIGGDMLLRRWSAERGAAPPERRRLDLEAGRYVRAGGPG